LLFTKSKLRLGEDFISFGDLNLVHPAMYEKVVDRQITEREALSVLKAGLRRRFKSIKHRVKRGLALSGKHRRRPRLLALHQASLTGDAIV
jgi:hypothetical protein